MKFYLFILFFLFKVNHFRSSPASLFNKISQDYLFNCKKTTVKKSTNKFIFIIFYSKKEAKNRAKGVSGQRGALERHCATWLERVGRRARVASSARFGQIVEGARERWKNLNRKSCYRPFYAPVK